MNVRSSHPRPGRKVASIAAIVPVAICALAITLTSAAQQAAPAPTPAAPSVAGPKVQFKAPTIPALKAGVPSAFNLCTGTPIQVGKTFTDADGLKLDNQQSPCGEKQGPSNVSGGNPPYSFQWSSGGFPPLGMHLTSNGLLYGTPAPHIGGYPPFKVCAVDMSANEDCREVTMGTQPAAQQAATHSKAPLVIGLLGGAAVAGVVGARAISSSSSSGSGDSAGQCDGFGSTVNSCGPCTCGATSACTDSAQCGGGQCFRYSEDGNQPAPFCSGK
jgi:hypothetical protein